MCRNKTILVLSLSLIFAKSGIAALENPNVVDRAWKGAEITKKWFIYDFKRRLVTSRYADQLPVDLFGFGSVASTRMGDYLSTMKEIMNEAD